MDTPIASPLHCPPWFTGPQAIYDDLYGLRQRIHEREERLTRRLRRIVLTGLGLLLLTSFISQFAFAAGDGRTPPGSILFISLLPVVCGLVIAAIYSMELRFADMSDEGRYIVRLQECLRWFLPATPDTDDPIARLLQEDAGQLAAALAGHQQVRPALVGHHLQLGQ